MTPDQILSQRELDLKSTDRITGNKNIFKELGGLQQRSLYFLAENPENHKQAIQQRH